MVLVALAWMYVVLMMAAAEAMSPQGTVLGAVFTFVMYGVLPLSIVLYLMGTPARRKARRRAEAEAEAQTQDRAQAQAQAQVDAEVEAESLTPAGSPPPSGRPADDASAQSDTKRSAPDH
jgi:membrane protein implicated in regulation of membrane protease activity